MYPKQKTKSIALITHQTETNKNQTTSFNGRGILCGTIFVLHEQIS